MKTYKIKEIKTPILDKCFCDKCKEPFEECDLTEIQCFVDPVNLAHGEFCNKCLHELIKDHCRYNFDLGWDDKTLEEFYKENKDAD